jgi:putative ABC transport system permease protein
MRNAPSLTWHYVVTGLLWALLPKRRRNEVKGDLIELWTYRQALGRRDLWRATARDVVGLLTVTRWRELHGGRGMWQDVRYAVRSWSRRPGAAVATILTLALGIGASTAIFSALDALLLRPLPYPSPDRLVHVTNGPIRLMQQPAVSKWFRDLPEVNGAGAWQQGGANVEVGLESHRVHTAVVDDGFFRTMAVEALIGNVLPTGDARGRFVVVSYGLWRTRLGGDRSAVGRDLSINGRSYEIVGVMPPGFGFPGRSDAWIPPAADFQVTGEVYAPNIVARLAPGVSLARAEGVARAAGDDSRVAQGRERVSPEHQLTLTPLTEHLPASVRPTMILLSVSVGLVLLVVCVSVANILLARVAGRRQELIVRRALGASSWRLARSLMVESLLVVVAGGLAGMFLAAWATGGLTAVAPRLLQEAITQDQTTRVFVIGLSVSLFTAVLTGLLPAWGVATRSAMSAVRSGRGAGDSAATHRLRNGLVIAQMALALILLSASAAAVSALVSASRVDLGFGGTESVVMQVSLPQARFATPDAIVGYADKALASLRAIPGVVRAGAVSRLPGAPGVLAADAVSKVGAAASNAKPPQPVVLHASPDYFAAMGIRLLAGRAFDETDRRGAPPVVILSEGAAAAVFGDARAAVGARVEVSLRTPEVFEVVGVVADVHLRTVDAAQERMMQLYHPITQRPPYADVSFVVETARPVDHVRPDLVDALGRVDRGVPVYDVTTVADVEGGFLTSHRLSGALVSTFAIVTLIVAAIGLFGLLSQVVSERTRETGIRLALGATTGEVGRQLVGRALTLAAIGAGVGVVGAVLGSQALATVVPSLEGVHAGTLVANALLLLLVAGAAAAIPAARARGVDPAKVLRDDV